MEEETGLDWEMAELEKLNDWANLTDTKTTSNEYKQRKAIIMKTGKAKMKEQAGMAVAVTSVKQELPGIEKGHWQFQERVEAKKGSGVNLAKAREKLQNVCIGTWINDPKGPNSKAEGGQKAFRFICKVTGEGEGYPPMRARIVVGDDCFNIYSFEYDEHQDEARSEPVEPDKQPAQPAAKPAAKTATPKGKDKVSAGNKRAKPGSSVDPEPEKASVAPDAAGVVSGKRNRKPARH